MAVHKAQLHEDVAHLNPDIRIWIVVSEFNRDLVGQQRDMTLSFLKEKWFNDVDVFYVPWAFEIPAIVSQVVQSWLYSVVITLWCVIQWETPHFDYICDSLSVWLMNISTQIDIPLVFWVLTCDTYEQAAARVNENYAIYALNYLVQRGKATQHIDKRIASFQDQAMNMMWDMVSEV